MSSALPGMNPARAEWKRSLRALRPEGAENQVALDLVAARVAAMLAR
jgi:hypothetical protein